MPRSKNPNPRQVTEGDESNDKDTKSTDDPLCGSETYQAGSNEENEDDTRLDLGEIDASHGRSSPDADDISAKRSSLAKLAAQKFGVVYCADDANANLEQAHKQPSPKSSTEEENPEENARDSIDADIKPRTSLNFSPTSPPSFFVVNSKLRSSSQTAPSSQNSVERTDRSFVGATNEKKAKSNSAGILNPKVMTWMRNRFQMRPGGRISASDIINLYKSDTKHLQDPPPGLQNYQVGQLLRRVFPTITRCKITVNGKRYWVYKHLNLVEDPPENLFEDPSPAVKLEPENELGAADTVATDNFRYEVDGASDSPMSNVEDGTMEDDDNSPSPRSLEDDLQTYEGENKEKSNAILLGLLGKGVKSETLSRTSVGAKISDISANEGTSLGDGNAGEPAQPKKKRDSEVIDWLKGNYKFKPGYYVKSMDLLRKYNNGRVEMVKYLSQVGRVMKHVFPAVRHLRKSFKGGKREWVYLNLKPLEVDSDSEEGKSMLMPTMRRSTGSFNIESSSTTSNNQRPLCDWKRERVNITHAPLSLVQSRNAIFKPRGRIFHKVSHLDGHKLVIKRNASTHLGASERLNNCVVALQKNIADKPANRTRIILYNKQDAQNTQNRVQDFDRSPIELERDIFAPFTKISHVISGSSSDKSHAVDKKDFTGSSVASDEEQHHLYEDCHSLSKGSYCDPTSVQGSLATAASSETGSNFNDDANQDQINKKENILSGLDLSVKKEPMTEIIESDSEGTLPVDEDCGDKCEDLVDSPSASEEALNLSKPGQAVMCNGKGVSSSQTIHYHPQKENASKSPQLLRIRSLKRLPAICSGDTSAKRLCLDSSSKCKDGPITWQSLQTFNTQKYGWLRSSDPYQTSCRNGKKVRFVEWFLFSGQLLMNNQRALREIKIYEDWTVVIHALGRRVYPNDLGGITDLEKTSASLNKVFCVLAEAKLCMGFPAPSVGDLYIHGILVSKFEVWSSREEHGEDMRQRAVNCQILYSGPGACCNKCARIMKLHQQQRNGVGGSGKRVGTDFSAGPHFQTKQPKA